MTENLVYRLFIANEWMDRGISLEDYRGKFTELEVIDYLKNNDCDTAVLTDDDLNEVAVQAVEYIPIDWARRTVQKVLQFKDGKCVPVSTRNQKYVEAIRQQQMFMATGNTMPGMWKDDNE